MNMLPITSGGCPALVTEVADKRLARLHCAAVLILGDALCLAVAFLLANVIYIGEPFSRHGLIMLVVLAPIYFAIAVSCGAYGADVVNSASIGVIRCAQALAIATSAIMFIAYFLKAGSEFSRAVLAIGLLGFFFLLPFARKALQWPLRSYLGDTPYNRVVIVDGVYFEPDEGDLVITADVIGFSPATSDPLQFDRLAAIAARADRLIVACPAERYLAWSSVLKGLAVHGEILTGEHDHLGIIGLGWHRRRQTMVVAVGPLSLHQRILKRLFDIVLSSVALIVLSPIFVATAIAIRLESPGPVLFRQNRIGRHNKIFQMFKFRSMHIDMCDPDASKLTSRGRDPRVTRVGEFIRRTSIDELPQLVNILKGEMSIVGPRPHAMAAKAADLLYWDIDPRYRHRHSMKPGLTGLAQIRGFRGATNHREDLTNRLLADLEYANDWSVWRDIWIILRTLPVVRHTNAF